MLRESPTFARVQTRALRQRARLCLALAPIAILGASIFSACGDESGGNGPGPGGALSGGQPGAATATGTTAGTAPVTTGGSAAGGVSVPGGTTGSTAGTTGTTSGTASVGAGPTGGTGSLPGGTAGAVPDGNVGTGGAGGTAGVPTPTFLDGDVDGDPSKPVVAIQGIPCSNGGGALGGLGGLGVPVPGTANTKITNRDVIISYPCNKHEGAHVTFILNLHGTMMDESLKFYQHGYFAAYTLASSHNLIVAEPKSVVSQWGNGDNGADKPHLYDVIDWVYTTFGTKFKITGLWVGGHSWGSAFAKTFACDEKLKERVRGVIGMSGGATGVGSGGFTGGGGGTSTAGCADRVSQIHTVGDQEGQPGVPDQTTVATKHGCKAMVGPKDIGNMQMLTEWPECSPGWTHFNFVMGAHQHTTPINPEVVKYIIEGVKKTEKK